MKRLTAIRIGVAAAVVALGPAVAWAQYPTPLRYDLRYTSPTYIPSGTLRHGPPQQPDPYRFGNPLHGNLGVTGNLRLGKSFRGTTPYTATGSQLSDDLPSNRLSDFRRDSFGLGDLGTGLQYGGTEAYYPDMGTVTTPWTAGRRFDAPQYQDRASYLPPNYNVLPRETVEPPGNIFTGSGGWTGLSLDNLQAAAPGGYSLGAPQTTEELLESLRSLPMAGAPEAAGEEQEEAGEGTDPLKYPYDIFEKRFQADPMNLFGVKPARQAAEEESPYERTMKLQYAPEATDLDRWVHPMPEEEERLEEPRRKAPEDDAAASHRWTGRKRTEQDPSDATRPWAGFGTAAQEGDRDGLAAWAARRRLPHVPTKPTSGYGRYVLGGHEALRQGEYGRAESLYAAAAALERDRPGGFFGRVHALLASRMYLQAAAVLERGLTDHPEWAKQPPRLKAVYPEEKVFNRIRRDIQREVGRGSARPGYRLLRAYIEFAAGNPDKARSYLTGAAEPSGAEKVLLEAVGDE